MDDKLTADDLREALEEFGKMRDATDTPCELGEVRVDLSNVTNDELAAVMKPEETVRTELSRVSQKALAKLGRQMEAATAIRQTFIPTGTCCDKRLRKTMLSADFAQATLWTCPACGCDWKPRMECGLKLWEPYPIVEIHRGRKNM